MKPSIYRDLLFALAIGVFMQACAHGPYKGRVLDEITGEPMAGAVAVASWSDVHVNVGGGTSYCIDAAEAVTDEKGEFEILGRRAPLFGTLGTMHIHIYKVGFQRVECMWKYMSEWGTCFTEPVEFDGDRAVFPLRRVAKDKMNTATGRPPHISCGRKDGKPLTEFNRINEDYYQTIEKSK